MRKYGMRKGKLRMIFYIGCLLLAPGIAAGHRAKEQAESCAEPAGQETSAEVRDYIAASAGGKNEEAPEIAITFDDGPNETWTPVLLDGLRERKTKASFFLIGENAARYPELVKRMDAEGHLVGNHTYSHVQLTALSTEEALREITETGRVIREITGKEPEFMRPPFGAWKRGMEAELKVLPVMWTVDPLDWTTENADEVVNRVVTETEEHDIILLHDCYESSVTAALRCIDLLRSRGFEFVTADELIVN